MIRLNTSFLQFKLNKLIKEIELSHNEETAFHYELEYIDEITKLFDKYLQDKGL